MKQEGFDDNERGSCGGYLLYSVKINFRVHVGTYSEKIISLTKGVNSQKK